MNKHVFLSAVCLIFTAAFSLAQAQTYVLGELSENIPSGYSGNSFSPPAVISLATRANCDGCKETHTEIVNRGVEVKRYQSATLLGRADYADAHFLIVHGQISKDVSEDRVFDDQGHSWSVAVSSNLALSVSRQAEFIQVFPNFLQMVDLNTSRQTRVEIPAELQQAFISTDNQQAWAVIGLDKTGKVWMGDGKTWTGTRTPILGELSDREAILSVYPHGDELVGAVYSHLNIYNKGVMLLYGKVNQPTDYAWIINSDDKNYGFSPAVKWDDNVIVVAGRNSSDARMFAVRLPESAARRLTFQTPPHAIGFEEAQYSSVMAGVSVAYVKWDVKSNVENLSNVQYNIANTLYKGVNFEGRYFERNLAVSYLKNQSEDLVLQSGGSLAREASSQLFAYLDFDSFIHKSHSLRIVFESASINGVATYNAANGTFQAVNFNNRCERLGLYDLGERGRFYKLELTKSQLPLAIGFSDSGPATASYFDTATQFTELAIGIGYDELAYAKRYEANYQRWYVSGAASFGLGEMVISDAVVAQAKTHLTRSLASKNTFAGLHGNAELGYLFQQRLKSLRGFGHSFSAGLKIQYDSIGAGYSPNASTDKQTTSDITKPNVQFNRIDMLWEPFVRYNLMF